MIAVDLSPCLGKEGSGLVSRKMEICQENQVGSRADVLRMIAGIPTGPLCKRSLVGEQLYKHCWLKNLVYDINIG